MPAVDRVFLANLADDPGENTNVAAAHPDVVARLTAVRDAAFADIARERPTSKGENKRKNKARGK